MLNSYYTEKVAENSFTFENGSLWIELNKLEKHMVKQLFDRITDNLPNIDEGEYLKRVYITMNRRYGSRDYEAAIAICRYLKCLIETGHDLGLPDIDKIVVFPHGKGNRQASAFLCVHLKLIGRKYSIKTEFVCSDRSRVMTISTDSLKGLEDRLVEKIWDQLLLISKSIGGSRMLKVFGMIRFSIDSI